MQHITKKRKDHIQYGLHFRILSTVSKAGTTLYSIRKQHHRKVLLSSFHLNGHTVGFRSQTQNLDHLVEHNKQRHSKVLLSSFHLNGHTVGFHSQSQNLDHLVQHNKQRHSKVLLNGFHLSSYQTILSSCRSNYKMRQCNATFKMYIPFIKIEMKAKRTTTRTDIVK